jgi:hypothetical protein
METGGPVYYCRGCDENLVDAKDLYCQTCRKGSHVEEIESVFIALPTAGTTVAGSILAEAKSAVTGARNATHGARERSFAVIAALWSSYLAGRAGVTGAATIKPIDVSNMMVLLKIARSIQGTPIRDHYVDMAGYAAISGELAQNEG